MKTDNHTFCKFYGIIWQITCNSPNSLEVFPSKFCTIQYVPGFKRLEVKIKMEDTMPTYVLLIELTNLQHEELLLPW